MQAFLTLDMQLYGLPAAQLEHLLVQGMVARHRGDVAQVQVLAAHRRQDADAQGPHVELCGRRLAALPATHQGDMHAVEHTGREVQRRVVDLEIEARQLGHHLGVADPLQELLVARRRHALLVHQPALEFESQAKRHIAQTALVFPGQQQFGLRPQAPAEFGEGRLAEMDFVDFLAHGFSLAGCTSPRLEPHQTSGIFSCAAPGRAAAAARAYRHPATVRGGAVRRRARRPWPGAAGAPTGRRPARSRRTMRRDTGRCR